MFCSVLGIEPRNEKVLLTSASLAIGANQTTVCIRLGAKTYHQFMDKEKPDEVKYTDNSDKITGQGEMETTSKRENKFIVAIILCLVLNSTKSSFEQH